MMESDLLKLIIIRNGMTWYEFRGIKINTGGRACRVAYVNSRNVTAAMKRYENIPGVILSRAGERLPKVMPLTLDETAALMKIISSNPSGDAWFYVPSEPEELLITDQLNIYGITQVGHI